VPTKTKPSKRDAILDATLDLIVERGFHDAPMSLISERSGASAGVIYHYFDSKEAIIHALYERLHTLKRSHLLAGYTPEMEAREALLLIWTNMYHFFRKHSREMRFLKQYEHAGFECSPEKGDETDPIRLEMERRFRSRSKGGELNELPPEVIFELTFGVVERLAQQPKKLSSEDLRKTAEKVWEAIRADDTAPPASNLHRQPGKR